MDAQETQEVTKQVDAAMTRIEITCADLARATGIDADVWRKKRRGDRPWTLRDLEALQRAALVDITVEPKAAGA